MRRSMLLVVPVLLAFGLLILLLGSSTALAGDLPPCTVDCLITGFTDTPRIDLQVHELYKEYSSVSYSWQTIYDLWWSIPISPGFTRINTEYVSWGYTFSKAFTFGGTKLGASGMFELWPPAFSEDVMFHCQVHELTVVDSWEQQNPQQAVCNTSGSFQMTGTPKQFKWTSDESGGSYFDWPNYPAPMVSCERDREKTINYHYADGSTGPFFYTRNLADRLYFSWTANTSDVNDVSDYELSCHVTGIVYLPGPMPPTPTITPTIVITATPIMTTTPVTGTTGDCVGIACPGTMVPRSTVPVMTIVPITPDPVNFEIGEPGPATCNTLLPSFDVDQWILNWHVDFHLPEQRLCVSEQGFVLEAFGFDFTTFTVVMLVAIGLVGGLYSVVKRG